MSLRLTRHALISEEPSAYFRSALRSFPKRLASLCSGLQQTTI